MRGKQSGGFPLSRRDVLRIGAIPLLGVSLPKLLAAADTRDHHAVRPPAKNIILVWLDGGPSTIDMWDLKPDAKSTIRGEFSEIPTTADGISIGEHLPRMARQMHHCTLVRSLTHTVSEHTQGAEHVLTGNPIRPALKYPSIGAIVASQSSSDASQSVPAYMDLTTTGLGGAGYLGASHDPFVVDRFADLRRTRSADQFTLPDGLTIADLDRRRTVLNSIEEGFRRFDGTNRADEMSAFQQQALNILAAGKTRAALNIFEEERKVVEQYGQTSLGQSALAARRLVQAGVRFVTIGMGGWDTHAGNFTQLRSNLLPTLDRALAALIEDLDTVGLLEETIVYCAGEFNRTPIINAQGGRDHWARSMSVLIAGGGFKPGFVYGTTDKDGAAPDSFACAPADVNATILNRIGIPRDMKLISPDGRPMAMFHESAVLDKLYA